MVMDTDVYPLPLTHSEHARVDGLKGASLDPQARGPYPEPSSSLPQCQAPQESKCDRVS